MTIELSEFLTLRNNLPIVDVRSENEYGEGHIPQAYNIPILNDGERKEVGIDYKQKGQVEAIKKGFKLVGPRLHDIIATTETYSGGREILVYCWRGGMRSGSYCQFVNMAGQKTYSLKGGYKTYRNAANESFKLPFQFILLTGYTGSGKSEVLRKLEEKGEQVLDLEKMASHKGSAFGGLMMPSQPTTEQFQNELYEKILTLDLNKRIWVEDESIAIGKIFLPSDFWQTMHQSPLVQMEVSKEVRIQRLVNEYGNSDKEEFLEIMGKITRKLGGQNYIEAKQKLLIGDMASTIEILLTYYDKAYKQSIEKRKEKLTRSLHWDGNSLDDIASVLIETKK
jgi:tRNA 2-selenouridine synthase